MSFISSGNACVKIPDSLVVTVACEHATVILEESVKCSSTIEVPQQNNIFKYQWCIEKTNASEECNSLAQYERNPDGIKNQNIRISTTGNSTIKLCVIDNFERKLCGAATVEGIQQPQPTEDTVAPTGTISINNGLEKTIEQTVSLTLTAQDDVGITGFIFSENGSFTPWQTISATKNLAQTVNFKLSSGLDEKKISVWFRDAAGNISVDGVFDSILFINAPPPVPPTNLTATAKDHSVLLSWDAVTGVSNYKIYLKYPNSTKWSHISTVIDKTTFDSSLSGLTLQNGLTHQFYLTALNSDLIESQPSNTVSIEPKPSNSPFSTIKDASVTIINQANDGIIIEFFYDTNHGTPIVKQGFTIISEAKEQQYIENSIAPCNTKCEDTFTILFSQLDFFESGEYLLRTFVENETGVSHQGENFRIKIDFTSLDFKAAPQNTFISINNGAQETTTREVQVHIKATDNIGLTGYYLSEINEAPSLSDFNWNHFSSKRSFDEEVNFLLGGNEGSKTLYVWFRDAAGNIAADQASIAYYPLQNNQLLDPITVNQIEIEITVWDNAEEDGDRIKVILNNEVLQEDLTLTNAAKIMKVTINTLQSNILKVIALNEGSMSPNTASMKVSHVIFGQETQNWKLNTGDTAYLEIKVRKQ
ncbi:fibronectin type III domain-containing protein [Deltaproteobacteria bacterium TL4]